MIYEPLESLCHIPEAKKHFNKLKQSEGCSDSSFGYIGGDHKELVVGAHEIKFWEDCGALQ